LAIASKHATLGRVDFSTGCTAMPFFVYILASKRNGTLYIGVTNDIARRISEHKAKLIPGFTQQYDVTLLVYFETFESVLEARSREHTLKRWRRAWKLKLIEELNPDWRDLTDELNTLAA
jgi:putative endonuclease